VRTVKLAWWAGHRRTYRPWVPEPWLWLQFDWGDGPRVDGRKTYLFCAWLAWSRFRVVIPVWDQTMGSLVACLDATLRRIGGAPAYLLGDNAKTVTLTTLGDAAARNRHIGGATDVVAAEVHDRQVKRIPPCGGQVFRRGVHVPGNRNRAHPCWNQ
jgi:hypothetical protein